MIRHLSSIILGTFLFSLVPVSLLAIEFPPDDPFPDPTLPTKELTVTVRGSGTVQSNPEGLVCEANMTTSPQNCTASFLEGSMVALDATPESGKTFTASFGNWSGDCNGTVGACAVTMDSDKTVTAQFVALGIPAFTLPVPNATETIRFHPPNEPVEDPFADKSKPIAVGKFSNGINVEVGLPPFAGSVDLYLGMTVPGSPDIFIFDSSDNFQTLSSGLVAWKSDVTSSVQETLFKNVPTDLLPQGIYDIFLMATPHNDTSNYYLWKTYFVIFPIDNPFLP